MIVFLGAAIGGYDPVPPDGMRTHRHSELWSPNFHDLLLAQGKSMSLKPFSELLCEKGGRKSIWIAYKDQAGLVNDDIP